MSAAVRGSRRPAQPSHETPITRGLTRLEPRDGLVVDAETWATAHGFHDDVSRLHGLAAHGWGVVLGLEVVPSGGRDVGVSPGIALDPTGNALVLTSGVRLSLDTAGVPAGPVRIVMLREDEEPDDDGRLEEIAVVRAVADGAPPSEPHVELARVVLGAQATVGYPVDPRQPNPDELDTRFRAIAGGHARDTVEVAELVIPEAGGGHAGAAALLARAVERGGAFRTRYAGEVRIGNPVPDGGILYATGSADFSLPGGSVEWLRAFLDGGGTVIGDGCHATPADPFGGAFDRLAKTLGRQLRRVIAGDRLLWAHHAFGAAPPGLVKTDIGLVLAAGGLVYCASDYGCVLRGGADAPSHREAIRAVEEFAANLVATASERRQAQAFLR